MEQKNSQQSQEASNPNMAAPMRVIQDKIPMYYSNCAMLATTPVDISIYFGRLLPVNQGGAQGLAEYFEQQVVVTVEQAKKLAQALAQTVQLMEARQQMPIQPALAEHQAKPSTAVSNAVGTAGAPLPKDDMDLEIEIPIEDLQEAQKRPAVRSSRSQQPAAPAQAVGPAPRTSTKIDV
ncbi:MAG: DUF3467 domain-containing protein [Desulfomonile tiedjei]|nr:DUF3467 domain-containing protein [Desulfomonile tiedjei]